MPGPAKRGRGERRSGGAFGRVAGRVTRRVLAGLALAALACSVHARTLTLEDLLQREAFGAIVLSPGERWLAVERRASLRSAGRFDVDSFNPLFRTEVLTADLTAGTGLRSLLRADKEVGYKLGPFSPDGARLAVYRLGPDGWRLGVISLASGAVRWLPVTPDVPRETRRLQWVGPTTLLVIAQSGDERPYELRAAQAHLALPERWAASARGEAAVTAIGSGRFLDLRAPAPPKRLLRIDVATGVAESLAQGDFVDLELSRSGRWLALVEAAEDIALKADQPVQGAYGIAIRRRRLRLVDLSTGALRRPCAGCDVLTSLLAWAPRRDKLLVYVRDDGAPWTQGRLVTWSPDAPDALRPVVTDIQARIARRPERVSAGWWDDVPLLLGRHPGGARDDWFLLREHRPVPLTAQLAGPPADGLVVGPTLLAAADGAAWSIDRHGRAQRLAAEPFVPMARRGEGVPDRTTYALRTGAALAGMLGQGAARRAAWIGTRTREVGPIPPDAVLAALGESGRATITVTGGGVETLAWRGAGAPLVLARLNPDLKDVVRPVSLPVHHRGPSGEALTSWLFVPPRPPGAPPPPLLLVPYPGRTYPAPPDGVWDDVPMAPTVPLLGAGYAVLLPSLPSVPNGTGPAADLAVRLLDIVAAAARDPQTAGRFDAARLGLWGHSFGGYAVATAISQTDRFAAAVAVAAPTDLASFWGQFEPSRRIYPDEGLSTPWTAGWTESLQGDMRAPPWVDPERYRRNSPLFQAGRIRTPLLLAVGDQDGAHPGQAEELFSALFRQAKDAVLLTYWGEGHVFASPDNLRDLYRRGFAFLEAGFRRHSTADATLTPPGRPEAVFASSGPTPPPRRPR